MSADSAEPAVLAGDAPRTAEGERVFGRLEHLARVLAVTLQGVLLTWLVHRFRLESRGFLHLLVLAWAFFPLHAVAPRSLRLPGFLLLSLAGVVVVAGWDNAAVIVAAGCGLIALCHLPVAWGWRYAALAVAGVVLALARSGRLATGVSEAVWPILASMFMFRLIAYLYDLRTARLAASPLYTLSYFFLLPNVCFPLFPVVDFKRFVKGHYDAEASAIYQRGVAWMFRGVYHLILYRCVYHYLVVDPAEVTGAATLLGYVVSSFLLYLRVSGQFHLIVGLLLLFGFNLPGTHHRYFLAASLTDFWRRINIYWKDFMMKVVFYPSHDRLRRFGPRPALILATAVVFLATWLLHAYQWFWLTGTFLLAWNDALFWGILGALVIVTQQVESRRGAQRLLGRGALTPAETAARSLRVVATFTVVAVLWSMWTSDSLGVWLELWRAAPLLAPALAVLVGALLVAAHLIERRARRPTVPRKLTAAAPSFWRAAAVTGAGIAGLLLLGSPEVYARLGSRPAELIETLRSGELNDRDAGALERGYYEHLIGVRQDNPELRELYARRPAEWQRIDETPAWRERDDFMLGELVPGSRIRFKDAELTINRWGMRDRDYERVKPPGTVRLAILGSSHVMGSGVADGETFEALYEERLDVAAGAAAGATRFEVLNFAVAGHSVPQDLYQLEHKVLTFAPDAVLQVGHTHDVDKLERYLARVVRGGHDLPWPGLRRLIADAGVEPHHATAVIEHRLHPHRWQILAWCYAEIVERCRAQGVTPLWIFVPMVEGDDDAEVDQLLAVAKTAGFRVLDLRQAYADRPATNLRLADWDYHPNAQAHRQIADALFEALGPEDLRRVGE